jgi:hypothetical protein
MGQRDDFLADRINHDDYCCGLARGRQSLYAASSLPAARRETQGKPEETLPAT